MKKLIKNIAREISKNLDISSIQDAQEKNIKGKKSFQKIHPLMDESSLANKTSGRKSQSKKEQMKDLTQETNNSNEKTQKKSENEVETIETKNSFLKKLKNALDNGRKLINKGFFIFKKTLVTKKYWETLANSSIYLGVFGLIYSACFSFFKDPVAFPFLGKINLAQISVQLLGNGLIASFAIEKIFQWKKNKTAILKSFEKISKYGAIFSGLVGLTFTMNAQYPNQILNKIEKFLSTDLSSYLTNMTNFVYFTLPLKYFIEAITLNPSITFTISALVFGVIKSIQKKDYQKENKLHEEQKR